MLQIVRVLKFVTLMASNIGNIRYLWLHFTRKIIVLENPDAVEHKPP